MNDPTLALHAALASGHGLIIRTATVALTKRRLQEARANDLTFADLLISVRGDEEIWIVKRNQLKEVLS